MPTNETPQVSGNNNIIQDISDDNLFVRLWKQGKEILAPLSNLFKSVTDVIPESASEENKLVTEADLKDVTDLIPEGTTEENPLVNVASLKILEEELLSINPPAANTLRFEFSKMAYDPTVAGVGSSGTWKKLSSKFHNVWDWTGSGTSFANAFSGSFSSTDNLVSVIAAGDTSAVTNMNSMLENCTSLTSVPLFNTSAVTDMGYMFHNCTSLTSVPLFDTSAVTNMYNMFSGCESLTSVPLFDTSAVTNMGYMFHNCTSLTSVPLFDTSAVTDMGSMFQICTSLTSVPLFNTSAVTNMGSMFYKCTSLTSVPLFDTSNAKWMYSMFYNCTSLTSVPLFDTSAATHMNSMFYNCTKVESGALALYQQASTQTTPPSNHLDTFKKCGSDTTTGAAELAQIPASWGGTASA